MVSTYFDDLMTVFCVFVLFFCRHLDDHVVKSSHGIKRRLAFTLGLAKMVNSLLVITNPVLIHNANNCHINTRFCYGLSMRELNIVTISF